MSKFGTPEKALNAPGKLPKQCQTLLLSDKYNVPLLEEMQVDLSGIGKELYHGGETEALARMEKYMSQQVSNFSIWCGFLAYYSLNQIINFSRIGCVNLANRTRPPTASNHQPLC